MVTDAAVRHGVRYDRLARWLRKHGIPYTRGMRVPTTDIDRVVRAMKYRPEGETVSQAAKRLHVQPETLAKWLKRHGVAVVQGSPIPTAEINRIVAIMRPATEGVVPVAGRLGVHAGTLRIWLRSEGVEIRKGYAYRGDTLLSVAEIEAIGMRRKGVSVAA